MIVKPHTFKKLIGVRNGKIESIPIIVMRKPLAYKRQKLIKTNAICIVCDYRFYERKIRWTPRIKAICHPFKQPHKLPTNRQLCLLSESDFCDALLEPVDERRPDWDEAGYDFVYFTLLSRQGIRCKGLYMLDLIDEAATKLGLRGVVINYGMSPTSKHKSMMYRKSLNRVLKRWKKFESLKTVSKCFTPKKVCAIMKSVNFVLFPNDADASPRLIPEALIRDAPVVVNSRIYGGWKYVNDKTGAFFDSPTLNETLAGDLDSVYLDSLMAAMQKAMAIDKTQVADAFYSDYGFRNSTRRLAKLINNISGKTYKAVAFRDWKSALYQVAKDEGWIK